MSASTWQSSEILPILKLNKTGSQVTDQQLKVMWAYNEGLTTDQATRLKAVENKFPSLILIKDYIDVCAQAMGEWVNWWTNPQLIKQDELPILLDTNPLKEWFESLITLLRNNPKEGEVLPLQK